MPKRRWHDKFLISLTGPDIWRLNLRTLEQGKYVFLMLCMDFIKKVLHNVLGWLLQTMSLDKKVPIFCHLLMLPSIEAFFPTPTESF